MDLRIHEHPILEFERGRKVTIYFNGKPVKAYENETVASALYASGLKIFTRSRKYHRPRGFFCAIGKCSSCMMRVDGIPNTRTCIVQVKDGMRIETQNSFPSAENDIFSVFDYLFPKYFDYHKAIKPAFLTPIFHWFVRKLSGLGKVPEKTDKLFPVEERETEIAIVGGGPAGLCAAIEAAYLGAKVTLIDENPKLGGQLVKQTHKFFGSAEHYAGERGIDIAKILIKETENLKIDLMLESFVTGIYEKTLGVLQKNRFVKLKAEKIIVATGAYENTLVFENNDLPGVYGAGGVQTLMNVYGVKPGKKALIVGSGNVGLILAYQLIQAGVDVRGIVEALPKIGGYVVHAAKVRRFGVPIYLSHTVKKALGRKYVKGAEIVMLDENWNEVKGSEKRIDCDIICIAVGLKPTPELVIQAGCDVKFVRELGGHVALRSKYMETSVEGIYVAGDNSGIEEASSAMMEGRIAGIHAATKLYPNKRAQKRLEKIIESLEELRSGPFGERVRKGEREVLVL